ncbi:MAG: ABC transporter ATP-binding protein [Pirellulaceae bacterium]
MTITLQNVRRDFPSRTAVDDVSCQIPSGCTLAVLGANGAGKSTLLRLIAGWLPTSTGRIQIGGYTMRINSVSVRRKVMLLDEPILGEASIVEMISQAVDDYKIDRVGIETEVAEWFERLDLVGIFGQSANAVSKGQRYKIAMICLFIVRPHVWLLDEPFSAGLDAGGLQTLETEMAAHAQSGGIVIFSSQWPDHANRLANRCLVLHEGQLICDHSVDSPVSADLLQAATPSLRAVLQGLGKPNPDQPHSGEVDAL